MKAEFGFQSHDWTHGRVCQRVKPDFSPLVVISKNARQDGLLHVGNLNRSEVPVLSSHRMRDQLIDRGGDGFELCSEVESLSSSGDREGASQPSCEE